MTVPNELSRNDYPGDDSTGPFAYGFPINVDADLLVTKQDAVGVEVTLVLITDYTVSGAGDLGGGEITTVANVATGEQLTIRRRVTITQTKDIKNQGAFFPKIHENVFDKNTFVDQQQQDELDRSAKLPETIDPANFDMDLPTAIEGSSELVIGTNLAGDGLALGPSFTTIETAAAIIAGLIPGMTTDHAITRFDGINGVMQNSIPTIEDDGQLLAPRVTIDNIDIDGSTITDSADALTLRSNVITHTAVSAQAQYIINSDTNALLQFRDTGAAADEKYFNAIFDDGAMSFQLLTDAFALKHTAMTIGADGQITGVLGLTVDNIDIDGNTIQSTSGNLTFSPNNDVFKVTGANVFAHLEGTADSQLRFSDTGAGADLKHGRWLWNAGTLRLELLTDAIGVKHTPITFNSVGEITGVLGLTVDNIDIDGNTIQTTSGQLNFASATDAYAFDGAGPLVHLNGTANSQIWMGDSGAAVDKKNLRMIWDGGGLNFDYLTDAFGLKQTVFSMADTGAIIASGVAAAAQIALFDPRTRAAQYSSSLYFTGAVGSLGQFTHFDNDTGNGANFERWQLGDADVWARRELSEAAGTFKWFDDLGTNRLTLDPTGNFVHTAVSGSAALVQQTSDTQIINRMVDSGAGVDLKNGDITWASGGWNFQQLTDAFAVKATPLAIDGSGFATFNSGNASHFTTLAGSSAATLRLNDTGAGADLKFHDITFDDGQLTIKHLLDTTATKHTLFVGESDGDVYFPAGNVGIGATPTTNLHVYEDNADTAPALTIEQDGAGDAAIHWLLTAVIDFAAGIDNTDNLFKLNRGGTLGADTDMVIDGGGQFGFGTVPICQMHAYVNTALEASTLFLEQDGAGDVQIRMGLTGLIDWSLGIDNSDSDYFKLSRASDLQTNTAMWVDSSAQSRFGFNAAPAGAGSGVYRFYRDDALTESTAWFEQDGAGDSQITFKLTGGANWAVGIDNSDGDAFKIEDTSSFAASDSSSMRIGYPTGDVSFYQGDGFNAQGNIMVRQTSAPADGDIDNSTCALWFDDDTGTTVLNFKGKDSAGTVKTGSVTLT